jgi:hypothetical protein
VHGPLLEKYVVYDGLCMVASFERYGHMSELCLVEGYLWMRVCVSCA